MPQESKSELVYKKKNDKIHEVEAQLSCCFIVFHVIQMEDHLQITVYTFSDLWFSDLLAHGYEISPEVFVYFACVLTTSKKLIFISE